MFGGLNQFLSGGVCCPTSWSLGESAVWKFLSASRRSSSFTDKERGSSSSKVKERGELRQRGRHTSSSRGEERGRSMAVALEVTVDCGSQEALFIPTLAL